MAPIGMLRRVPVEDLDECSGFSGSRDQRLWPNRRRFDTSGSVMRGGFFKSIEQVLNRVRVCDDLGGQSHTECTFNAED
jgi:hypothetical protein